ncbi:MAG: TetR/AcrR family transcriptional regulator [Granulosicoccus sp.]|nr:TetR/AcrR family transcriptional regulator [Granulosicoccus sp.]
MPALQTDSATEKILISAEQTFSELGFDAASMKTIAGIAGVSQSLLHYHFSNKEHLYAEVVRRRADIINTHRRELLARVEFQSRDALEQVIDAFIQPPIGPAGGGKAYKQIFYAALIVRSARDADLIKECYDEIAGEFIDAICKTVPDIDRESAALGYSFALGSLVNIIRSDGRVERLSGRPDYSNQERRIKVSRSIVTYIAGGIRALATQEA